MGSTQMLKSVMKRKKITQFALAEMLGKPYNTVRNMLVTDNMTIKSLEEYANVLGCDVVLLDRETGDIIK